MSLPGRPGLHITMRDTSGVETTLALSGTAVRYVVGRADLNAPPVVELPVADRHVSRRHCVIAWSDEPAQWTLADMKSANGTTLDGDMLGEAPAPLRDGARVKVGATLLVFRFASPSMELADQATVILAGSVAASGAGHTPDGDDGTILLDPPRRDATATLATVGEATRIMDGAPATSDFDGRTAIHQPRAEALAQIQNGPQAEENPEGVGSAGNVITPSMALIGDAPMERRAPPNRGADADVLLGGVARFLVDSNLLDGAKAVALSRVARDTGRTYFRTLADDGTIKFHEEIYERVGEMLGLERITSEKSLMERAVPTGWLSFAQASKRGAVLLSSADDRVHFATIDPFDVMLDDWISRCAECRPHKILVAPSVFFSALQRLKNQGEDDDSGVSILIIDITPDEEQRIATQMEEIDVPQVVNYFLQRAFLQGASDIHIEPTEDYLLVRNRVDGILHEDTSLPVAMHPEIASRIKIISGMDVAEKRRPQDGRISSIIQGNAIDVRVSSYPTIYGEKVVMRLLDKNALRPSPEHLGMLARDLRLLYDKLNAPFGLVMISGPTGSGKTTTLYSCLGSIDKKSKNVLTVEDPVEYRLRGVHQMQVNDRIGLTFASGLRTILRQDPDVIMVGECRDTETAGMAIQASLTGHIVFSTIHTNDAVGVVTRLLDMKIDPFLVANALTLCIAQRLVRRVCKHCQTMVTGADVRRRLLDEGVTSERLDSLNIDIDDELTYVAGVGCVHCRNTGYQGRQAVFEVFEMTNAARNMIMSPNFNADELRRMVRKAGMTTLIIHGLQLIEEGITTHAEAIRVLGEAY